MEESWKDVGMDERRAQYKEMEMKNSAMALNLAAMVDGKEGEKLFQVW